MTLLQENMDYICHTTRMLAGLTVAYGTPQVFEWETCGMADEDTQRPLTQNSLYDLASLTKLFTSVAALQLVESGKLSLSDCAGRIEPRFENLQDVTVEDILSFRVCLKTPGRIDDAPTAEEGLRRLFGVTVCQTPAIRLYSDINAMVIKYLIEAKTGMAFYDVLNASVFQPAGMTETFSAVPREALSRCVNYNHEHQIVNGQYILRTDISLGTPNDPKASLLSRGGRDLCGHAGLFSTRDDMVHFAQALLNEKLLSHDMLRQIGVNRTGFPYPDGTHRQYLGYLCFSKHPNQYLSEIPSWMSSRAFGLSGFTGNHLSIDPESQCFVLFLGNRCHHRVSRIVPAENAASLGLDARGVGIIRWPDGQLVPSSSQYVHFKDEYLHAPIEKRLRALGWLSDF